MSTILGSKWWSPIMPGKTIFDESELCVGIVAVCSFKNLHSMEWKCYIGYGKGENQSKDEQWIAKHGNPLAIKSAAVALFPELDPEGYRS